MRKMIVALSLLISSVTVAGELNKMPMKDLIRTDMDYIYEIKTTKFDKVLLDCQSLRMGMSFSNKKEIKSDIYLDMFQCEDIANFLFQSKEEGLPVCIGLDSEENSLSFSRESHDCF